MHAHRLHIEAKPDRTTVRFTERFLDEASLRVHDETLTSLVRGLESRRLDLDMSTVGLLNGSWLRKLLRLLKQLRAVGGQLTLRNVDARLYELFAVTRLREVFEIHRKEPLGTAD